MSSEFNHRRRHSRHFWLRCGSRSGLGMVASFLLGGDLMADDWSRQEHERLAQYKPEASLLNPEPVSPPLRPEGMGRAAPLERVRPGL